MDKISLLKSVFIFSGLSDPIVKDMSKYLKEAAFKAGKSIFLENDKADAFYIIDKGDVSISKRMGKDKEKILSMLGPGSAFGEMAFFSDSPRIADATARTDSLLYKIERKDFLDFISRESAAGLKILSALLQISMNRLEHTSRELATVYHTGKIISSGKKLEEILAQIKEELLLAVPEADDAAIYLYNEFNVEFEPASAPSAMKEVLPDDPLILELKSNPEGLLFKDFGKSGFKLAGIDNIVKSIIIAPAMKGEAMEGFLCLWSAKDADGLKNSYKLLLSSVAGQLAEAIENIHHQQEERDRQRLKSA